jgi:hypothetical protein
VNSCVSPPQEVRLRLRQSGAAKRSASDQRSKALQRVTEDRITAPDGHGSDPALIRRLFVV